MNIFQAPVVENVDKALHWIMQLVLAILIRWFVIELSINVLSMKVLTGDTVFFKSPTGKGTAILCGFMLKI